MFTVGASDNYFEMIKIRPRLGRLLASRSDQALNAAPEVVLSHNFWARRLNSGPAAIGQTIWLSGVAFTVIGVAPPGFRGTESVSTFVPDLWMPLGVMPRLSSGYKDMFENRTETQFQLTGRLKTGVG